MKNFDARIYRPEGVDFAMSPDRLNVAVGRHELDQNLWYTVHELKPPYGRGKETLERTKVYQNWMTGSLAITLAEYNRNELDSNLTLADFAVDLSKRIESRPRFFSLEKQDIPDFRQLALDIVNYKFFRDEGSIQFIKESENHVDDSASIERVEKLIASPNSSEEMTKIFELLDRAKKTEGHFLIYEKTGFWDIRNVMGTIICHFPTLWLSEKNLPKLTKVIEKIKEIALEAQNWIETDPELANQRVNTTLIDQK